MNVDDLFDFLDAYIRGENHTIDSLQLQSVYIDLSRGIDFAIANHEIAIRAQELPPLLKQVCQCQNDPELVAAVMVLMISIKNACDSGWFSDQDSEDLRNLAQEVAKNFCSVPNVNTETSCSRSVISTIMSRFYPRMKMGQMLVLLEAKPGYEAYVSDFQISKNLKASPGEKIRLFVVQTDSFETSSCLITPLKVSFLLNGKGVERRTNISVDTAPQLPTIVAHMLKYGSNLLQAVGDFSGNYIIALAFMSEVPTPDSTVLQDYEEHAPTNVDSDSELIEGPSRISINCPISFRRIKTPVKGHSCKHHQCFDFDNYVDINSRRPSWRCPHCNQHVCFADIRIDQRMAKILKEVGPNVKDVIFSSDGSWNAVKEIDDATQKPDDKTTNLEKDKSPQHGSAGLPNTPLDVLDLTDTDDVMDIAAPHESEDRKFNPTACQLTQATGNPPLPNTSDVNQSRPQVEDDFWSGIYLSTFGVGTSNAQVSGVPVSPSGYVASPPVFPEYASSAANGEFDAFQSNALVTIPIQNETSLPNGLQLQPYQFVGSTITNEYGRFPSFPRHITRIPTAVQALPVQSPNSVLPQRSRGDSNPVIQNGFSAASQASPAAPLMANSTVHSTPYQIPPISSSPLHQYSSMQQQHRPMTSVQQPQQNVSFHASNQVANAYRTPQAMSQTSMQQPSANRTPQAMSQTSMQQPSANRTPQAMRQTSMQAQGHVYPTGVSSQQAHLIAAANRTAQMAFESPGNGSSYSMNLDGRRHPSVGDQRPNLGVASQPVNWADGYENADRNWRPAGRMRGALSGQAYMDAFNQFIARPAQQAQPTRPNVNSPTGNVPAHLQPFISERRLAANHPSAGSPTGPGNS